MAEPQSGKRRSSVLPYLLTPLLLMLLTAGIIILCYSVAPTHQLQKYLNIAFMDNLKTNSKTAGLVILEQEIATDERDETFEAGEIQYPVFGEQYAKLSIDAIKLDVGVFFGVNPELLERGACQSTQSAVIGETGNTVIDAHVNTFFSDLDQLKPGDTVKLYTNYGVFTYEVQEQITFDKNDKRYLAVTKTECLTLYTCKPQVVGSSDVRVGVRCVPVDKQFYTQAAGEEGAQ